MEHWKLVPTAVELEGEEVELLLEVHRCVRAVRISGSTRVILPTLDRTDPLSWGGAGHIWTGDVMESTPWQMAKRATLRGGGHAGAQIDVEADHEYLRPRC